MSSALFQPLLHDPLGWKQSTTTYNDTYRNRTYAPAGTKEKKLSPYGQDYQKRLRKQQQQARLFRSDPYFTQQVTDEQPTPRIILVKRSEERREGPPASYQLARSKTLPVVSEEPPTFASECAQQSLSTYGEPYYASQAAQRLPTAPADHRDGPRPAAPSKVRRNPREDKEKYMIDIDDDRYRHWLAHPTPNTPPQIVDIKQRLGQLKVPSTLSRTSASYAMGEQPQQQYESHSNDSSAPSLTHRQKKRSDDHRHFLDMNMPDTPPELRAARHRIDKYRYHVSLDNFPPRSEGHQDDEDDYPRSAYPQPYEDEQNSANQAQEESGQTDEENQPADYEPSATGEPTVDEENLPSEYFEALDISDAAQQEYLKNYRQGCEKRSDQPYYRIPTTSALKQDSFIAYRNQHQSTPPISNDRSKNKGEVGVWLRNSTDLERESAMKILNNVLTKPVMGYDVPKKQQVLFKRSGASMSARQLGQPRTHQRIPCEICEKQLIKHHIWGLSRSTTLTCPHQA